MGLGGEPERGRAAAVRGVEPLRIETDLQDPGLAPPPRCWCGRKPEMSGPFVSRAGADGVIARAITRLRHTLAAAAGRVRESSPDSSVRG